MVDPATTGLGTAAGTAVNALVPAKLGDQLFGPLATAYGDHWGAEARERLEAKRAAKRAKNAERQLSVLQRIDIKRDYSDLFADEQFESWAELASETDPDVDPDLADFWKATLLAIGNGDSARKRLLDIVKSLTPDDAEALAAGKWEGPRLRVKSDSGLVRRLEMAGILGNPWQTLITRPFNLLFVIFLPLAIFISLDTYENFIQPLPETFPAWNSFKITAILLSVGVSVMRIVRSFLKPVRLLTSDGYKLMTALAQVRVSQSKEPASSTSGENAVA